MAQKKVILIIDEDENRCKQLQKVLGSAYTIFVVHNKDKLYAMLDSCCTEGTIVAILLNLSSPSIEGIKVLQNIRLNETYTKIPILVGAENEDENLEIKALKLGATDFIKAPYNAEIIGYKLANILKLEQSSRRNVYPQKDSLTNIYNKQPFFTKASELIMKEDGNYDIVCLDIERFKLINDFFGMEMGDLVLKYIAEVLDNNVRKFKGICARLDSDIFVCCIPSILNLEHEFISQIEKSIEKFSLGFTITVKFGVYSVQDLSLPISAMCDRAMLAKQSVKGKYGEVCAYYDKSLREKLIEEQEIINDMSCGLVNGDFKVYYQPKYNLATGSIIGAEALVRWAHPKKGIIAPFKFIPLFEKNGFITTLDIYIWENVCAYIRERIDKGEQVIPISVNVSRVDIYNPNLVEILHKLVEKYNISPFLLELEITETAYTENPEQMVSTIYKLKEKGFNISMDDFGSGYSSLNMLSEVAVDTIKLDMKFLQNGTEDQKNGNILNFIVNLAKWMNVPVIAEGIETQEQVEYLKSIGCFKGQGYYFSKPLEEKGFTRLLKISSFDNYNKQEDSLYEFMNINEIWNPSSHFNTIFNHYVGALAIYEYSNGKLMFLRANDEYYQVIDAPECCYSQASQNAFDFIFKEDLEKFTENINNLIKYSEEIKSETRWWLSKRRLVWLRERIKIIYKDPNKTILLCNIEDITEQKESENSLQNEVRELNLLCEKNRKELDYLKFAYNNVSCGIVEFIPKLGKNVVNMNETCLKILGYNSKQEFLDSCGYNFLKIIPHEDRRKVVNGISSFLTGENQDSFKIKVVKKNGQTVWIKASFYLESSKPEKQCCHCFFTDITSKQKAEKHLEILKEQYIVYTKHGNNVIFRYNKQDKKATFIALDEEGKPKLLKIKNFAKTFLEHNVVFPESADTLKGLFYKMDAGNETGKVQIKARNPKGVPAWYEVSFFNHKDGDTYDDEVIFVFKDITDAKEQELLLVKQAKCDALTGLYNRNALQVQLSSKLEHLENNDNLLAFLMIDLDGFKEINDQYGHACGDQALVAVSNIFRSEIHPSDIVARIGGDEFVVILGSLPTKEDAINYATKICTSIERYKEKLEFTLSCSVGISIAPDHGMEFNELYRKADVALYNAKRLGKNMCCLFE